MRGMKFRDKKTGDVFRSVNDACHYFCNEFSGPCYQCPIRGDDWNCFAYVLQHPEEAAKRMGMEIIEDDGCNPDWSEAGKQFYKSLLDPVGQAEAVTGDKGAESDPVNSIEIEAIKMDDTEKKIQPVTETVDHPAHYNQGGVECIDALKAATVGLEGIQAFCTANAIKYLWRWKSKGGVEDLDKAIWYINRLKEEIRNG